MRFLTLTTLAAVFCLLGAVIAQPETTEPKHKGWDYPPFGETDAALAQALRASCSKFISKPQNAALHSNPVFGTYGQWQAICAEALTKPDSQLEDFLNTRLARVKIGDGNKFTGYYKPILEGSLTRHGPYQTPLLARPKDLTTCNGATGQKKPDGTCVSPYPARAQIMKNLGAYKVIAWLKDPLDAYFLHIQGSGAVELENGKLLHIGFAGKNGHSYTAIGKVLKEKGELTGAITADAIRQWLKTHPTRNDEILNANESFIFFHLTQTESPGAMGVPLTAGRSVAIDRDAVPFGIPLFISTQNTFDNIPFNRIMFGQDVGSAIKGKGRADIYFGHGEVAGKRAGSQNAQGRMFALVPKENVGEQALAKLEPAAGASGAVYGPFEPYGPPMPEDLQ